MSNPLPGTMFYISDRDVFTGILLSIVHVDVSCFIFHGFCNHDLGFYSSFWFIITKVHYVSNLFFGI